MNDSAAADTNNGIWLGVTCPKCGRKMNSWDIRCSKAVGYISYQVCELCLCKEYDKSVKEFRDVMESYFGMRPCGGI